MPPGTQQFASKEFASKDWTIVKNRPGWQALDLRELWQYRDLLFFLMWRDIKSRYTQSVLGVGWAIIQPVFNMFVFTIIFGNLANVSSDGVPYAIFNFTALVPWTYFANALSGAATSLVTSSSMISKVYFPRLLIPLAPALGKLVDFAIAMVVLLVLMVWFQVTPNLGVLALPLLVLIMILSASGAGMWLTALSIQYRDISYALSFIIQMLMYASPVVYPASSVPDQFLLLYSINPMVGVIEGFRSALLSTNPMPWNLILAGGLSAILLSVTGAYYFRRMERIFADVA